MTKPPKNTRPLSLKNKWSKSQFLPNNISPKQPVSKRGEREGVESKIGRIIIKQVQNHKGSY